MRVARDGGEPRVYAHLDEAIQGWDYSYPKHLTVKFGEKSKPYALDGRGDGTRVTPGLTQIFPVTL